MTPDDMNEIIAHVRNIIDNSAGLTEPVEVKYCDRTRFALHCRGKMIPISIYDLHAIPTAEKTIEFIGACIARLYAAAGVEV